VQRVIRKASDVADSVQFLDEVAVVGSRATRGGIVRIRGCSVFGVGFRTEPAEKIESIGAGLLTANDGLRVLSYAG